MFRYLFHFIGWFVASLCIYIYILPDIPELYYEIFIGFIVVISATYIATFQRLMIIVGVLGLLLSTTIVYYFVI